MAFGRLNPCHVVCQWQAGRKSNPWRLLLLLDPNRTSSPQHGRGASVEPRLLLRQFCESAASMADCNSENKQGFLTTGTPAKALGTPEEP